jgi:hypothetical protein
MRPDFRSIELEMATFNSQLRQTVMITGIKATKYGANLTELF